jgi:hypothetical protein
LNHPAPKIHKVELICPACVGATGGKATTDVKREASRQSGAKGDRPPKVRKDALA